MVTRPRGGPVRRTQASLLAEMVFGLGVAALFLIPLALTFRSESVFTRALYYRAVAMEVVDGEIELLVAGEWKAFAAGSHSLRPTAAAVTNLPPGQFTLTVGGNRVRLEWAPEGRHGGGKVLREVEVRP